MHNLTCIKLIFLILKNKLYLNNGRENERDREREACPPPHMHSKIKTIEPKLLTYFNFLPASFCKYYVLQYSPSIQFSLWEGKLKREENTKFRSITTLEKRIFYKSVSDIHAV